MINEPVVDFLETQKVTDEQMIRLEQDTQVGFRTVINDVSLPRNKKVPLVASFMSSDKFLRSGGDSYLSDCYDSISAKIKVSSSSAATFCSRCESNKQKI